MNPLNEKAAVLRAPSGALTHAASNALATRGLCDLVALQQADAWFMKGQELWAERKYQEAVDGFNRGLELDPHHAGLCFWLGDAYFHGAGVPRDDEKAFHWFGKASEADSESERGTPLWCEGCHRVHGLALQRDELHVWLRRGVCPLCDKGSTRDDCASPQGQGHERR
jgi:TPR repeat protein